MKRYSTAIIILAVLCCLLLAAQAALYASRLRVGLESLAKAANDESPELLDAYAAALIRAVPSRDAAEAGRQALAESGFRSLSVGHYTEKLLADTLPYFLFGAAALTLGGSALFLFIERKRRIAYEQELARRVNAALGGEAPFTAVNESERTVARLIGEVARANALRAESADEIRKYVENAAHEIKSPTSGILLNLDLMERGGITEARLSAARKCAARIDAYTSGLLSLARLRAGKVFMEFESTNLCALVRETAAELAANGVETLVSGESAAVNCDRVRVKEAVRNLIANAAKHSGKGSPVRVSVTSAERSASVTVYDNGPGIQSGALIERYSVGVDDGTSFGIGLSLAAEVAGRHSGKLIVKNPGGGSAVELLIPRFDLKESI